MQIGRFGKQRSRPVLAADGGDDGLDRPPHRTSWRCAACRRRAGVRVYERIRRRAERSRLDEGRSRSSEGEGPLAGGRDHRHAVKPHVADRRLGHMPPWRLADRILAEVKDRGGEHSAWHGHRRIAGDEVIERPNAAPEAMTGTDHGCPTTARVSAISKPALVPSRSIEVRRISPCPARDDLIGRIGDGVDPCRPAAAVREDLPPGRLRPLRPSTRLASTATTMHWLPNFCGRLTDTKSRF